MRRVLFFGLAVVVGALLPAAGSAGTAGTAISISVKTANNPVGGLVWVEYGKTAEISGTTSDGQAGTSVELQASVFPFGSGFKPLAQALTGAGGTYSFRAKPTLATRYRVVLVSDATSQSSVATVYAAAHLITRPSGRCATGPSCRLHFAAEIVYPAAVAKREAAKPIYDYFGVHYGSQTIPPGRIRLVQTGRQRRRGGRYVVGFSVTFPTVTAYYYTWEICTKDTEARDGLGLPGHHKCGARFLTHSAIQGYVG